MSVMLGVASSVADDVIMRIAGLVAAGTGRRYGDWRHVATGCNAVVKINQHDKCIVQRLYILKVVVWIQTFRIDRSI